MDTTYGYFSLPVTDQYTRGRKVKNGGKGYICIRVDRPPKNTEEYKYVATLSFCSPFDQFSKKFGRSVADRRMDFVRCQKEADQRRRHITVEFAKRPKMVEVFNAVLRKACSIEVKSKTGSTRPLMPRWFTSSTTVPGKENISYGLRTG
jgi:hypothetical protein